MTSARAVAGATAGRSVIFLHPSDEAYGADRVLLMMAAGLNARGHRVTVLLSDDQPPGWLSEQLTEAGIDVRRGPLAPARRRYLHGAAMPEYGRALLAARRFIHGEARRVRADVIHVNTSALLVAAVLGRPGGAGLVWHIHEIVERPSPAAWAFRAAPALAADRVIAISEAVAAHIGPNLPGQGRRVVVIPNGLEPLATMPPRPPRDEPVAVFLGRLNRWKGQEIFLEAAVRLAPEFPGSRFIIAGDPPQGEEWRAEDLQRRIDAAGLDGSVRLAGFVDDSATFFAGADVAVVPSTWPEPFGLVIIEAMRVGTPVVATNHGGATEIIHHGRDGYLIEPGDVGEVAAAVRRIFRGPALRDRLGAAGVVTAARYTAEAFVDAIERCHAEVAR